MPGLILTPAELHALTTHRQPAAQLRVLHSMGFWRARRARTGAVILERAHYEAVCARDDAAPQRTGPKLMPA